MSVRRNNRQLQYSKFALFIYASLIVDFYRKFTSNVVRLPVSTTMFRNLVYVGLFLVLVPHEKRKAQYSKLIFIGIIFALITGFSMLINWERNATSLYIDLLLMFVSRLLPAYYIGTMIVGNEGELTKSINQFQWLTLAYEALILIYPEVSTTSYLTISGNLLIPTLFAVFSRSEGIRGLVQKVIGIIGLIVIVVYGGRTSMVSIILAVGLIFLVKFRKEYLRKKVIALFMLICVVIFVVVFYENIINYLLLQNPGSRTLKLIEKGQFFWSSNRDRYYNAAFDSFVIHPFRIYGFLGDRFYYADYFGSTGDNSYIATMFSHNSIIEIMLNFGVFFGALIDLYLIAKIIRAIRKLNRVDNETVWITYIIIFTSAFVAMFISSSWLNDYTVWLLFGSVLTICHRTYGKKESQK